MNEKQKTCSKCGKVSEDTRKIHTYCKYPPQMVIFNFESDKTLEKFDIGEETAGSFELRIVDSSSDLDKLLINTPNNDVLLYKHHSYEFIRKRIEQTLTGCSGELRELTQEERAKYYIGDS